MYRAMNAFGWPGVMAGIALLLLTACMTAPPAPVVERSQPPTTRINHHVVSRGETLHTIAWRYELDHQQLAALNGLQSPYQLQSGQRLRLGDGPITVPAGPARAVAIASSPIIAEPISSASAAEPSFEGSGSSLEWVPMTDDPVDAVDPTLDPTADPTFDPALDPALDPGAAPTVAAPSDWPAEAPAVVLPSDPAPAPAVVTGPWQWPTSGSVTREHDAGGVFKGINIHSSPGTPVQAAGSGTVVYAGSGLRGYGQLIILKHDDTYLSAYAHNNRILVAENDTVSQGQAIGEVGGDPGDTGRLYFEIREHGKPVDPQQLLPPR